MASRLEGFTRLSADDHTALCRLTRNHRFVDPRRDLVSEGDKPRHVHLILDGWACRYKQLADGKRQILAFLVAGDLCDLHCHILRHMDHSIAAITRLRVAVVNPDEMSDLASRCARIRHALWWYELVTGAVQREWTVNLGLRSAYERLAHLLLELYLRLDSIGRTHDGRCDFPLTQNDLADATGLTSVHVNRTLQELRRDGLIELGRKQLQLLDVQRLMDASMFNANYLHLQHDGRRFDAND